MKELKCKLCGKPIKFINKKVSTSGFYEVSCGSMGCMNLGFFKKKPDALDYARLCSIKGKGSKTIETIDITPDMLAQLIGKGEVRVCNKKIRCMTSPTPLKFPKELETLSETKLLIAKMFDIPRPRVLVDITEVC